MTRTTLEITAMKRDLKFVNRADCCRNCTHFVVTSNIGAPNCNLMRWPTQPESICKKHDRRLTK